MKIQDQVATVEQCQKLEALGVECARPAYHWIFDSGMRWKLHPLDYYNLHEEGIEYHPAFTVAELGVMLPRKNSHTCKLWLESNNEDNITWCCGEFYKGFLQESTEAITQAQAMAEQLIYLLENNHITASEVNQRLQQ